MPSREEHLEAAKLAKLVGSQLNLIDNFHLERSNVPANRININKFIAQVTDPNGRQHISNSSGYVPEELVQKLVPDVVPANKPPEIQPQIQATSQIESQQFAQNDGQILPLFKIEQEIKPTLQDSSSDNEDNSLNRIADSLESIAKTFSKYVDSVIISSTIDAESKKTVLNE
jgi:hypothetical protein